MQEKIEILYQDNNLIIVDKPSGILVHPWKNKKLKRPCLIDLVRQQIDSNANPVHRLDLPVSGCLIFSLNKRTTKYLQDIWNTDLVEKEYLTLCRGNIPKHGFFDFKIQDMNKKKVWKESLTNFTKIHYFPENDSSLEKS